MDPVPGASRRRALFGLAPAARVAAGARVYEAELAIDLDAAPRPRPLADRAKALIPGAR